jgi:hypothetical protein
MTTAIVFHEVKDGQVWAKAWRSVPGSRHELFSKIGVNARTFRDPKNPNSTGLIFTILAKFQIRSSRQPGERISARIVQGCLGRALASVVPKHAVLASPSRISLSFILDIRVPASPNKAPEPTPGSVTPRATEDASR